MTSRAPIREGSQWQIEVSCVSVLSLHGPVETHGVVPVFKACVFGRTERADGIRRDGLNHDAWVVGRSDVRRTHRMDKPGEWWPPGEHVAKRGGVRGTLTRARNTARAVSAALADWEAYSAWIARKRADMHEDTRGTIAAQLEDEDESVVGVTL
ncbi:hypothetical protein [Lichenibacterium dinghuense]|uniref:hypothetical protein n=1 Tax=Lichenibacterium dinghuense TaxID=2895977 RepID=UPI001F3EFE9A|nr:hypothetical protein [Lichenibacterium sp. 6Y81]